MAAENYPGCGGRPSFADEAILATLGHCGLAFLFCGVRLTFILRISAGDRKIARKRRIRSQWKKWQESRVVKNGRRIGAGEEMNKLRAWLSPATFLNNWLSWREWSLSPPQRSPAGIFLPITLRGGVLHPYFGLVVYLLLPGILSPGCCSFPWGLFGRAGASGRGRASRQFPAADFFAMLSCASWCFLPGNNLPEHHHRQPVFL